MSQRRLSTGYPLSFSGRAWLLAISGLLVAGFALARSVEPDPRGFGTHQQFGLPECTFQILWNRPCPGCGMTTCFAHLVRGEWLAAARANPAGFLLGTVCALLIPWIWACVWRGETIGVNDPLLGLLWMVISLATATASVWGLRLWM